MPFCVIIYTSYNILDHPERVTLGHAFCTDFTASGCFSDFLLIIFLILALFIYYLFLFV